MLQCMILVADGNNVAWAGFHALGRAMGADTPERKTRATLLGLSQTLFGLVVRGGGPPMAAATPAERVAEGIEGLVVAFDQGRALRRREIYPAYQTGREGQSSFGENEPYVLAAIDAFIEASACMPVTILRGDNSEADDLIAAFAIQGAPTAVRIASGDRDFLQLVDERVSIYSPQKKLVIDDGTFDAVALPREKSGDTIWFPRDRFVDFRALCGDTSDDLPGVAGIGELTAARLLAHAPLDAYLDEPALAHEALQRGASRIADKLGEPGARAIVERNRALMDLRLGAEHYRDLKPYRRTGTWDEQRFRAWIEEQRMGRADTDAVVLAFERIADRAGLFRSAG